MVEKSSKFPFFKRSPKPKKTRERKKRDPNRLYYVFENKFRGVIRKKRLDFSDDPEVEEWLDEEVIDEAEGLLNSKKKRDEIVLMYATAKMNWLLALGEVKAKEDENRKLKREKQEIQNELNIALAGR